MDKVPRLCSPLYVDPMCLGLCTIISNHAQMSYMHTHDYYEAFLVISGTAVHHVNGKNFNLAKGSLVMTRPDDVHCYLHPISPDFQFVNVIISTDVVMNFLNFLGKGFQSEELLYDKYPAQRNLTPSRFEPLVSTLNQLMVFPKVDIERYNTAFKLAVIEILTNFFYEDSFYNKQSYPGWFRVLLSEMYKPENYLKGLPAMYEISNCAPEHLCRVFKKYLNTTPSKFLNDLRLEVAAQKIIYTDDPILSISQDVGFDNLSHFYHLFKYKYNMSPGKYRKHSRLFPVPEPPTELS